MIVKEINCKSILTKSGIEGVDYALNPYVGCAHGCVYCYASFMKRFTGHPEEWGTFVDVKVNAAEVLARQMRRAKPGNISSGTVTDPYQPLEARYEITRACLQVLADHDFPVSILTKSDLVLRDLDLLRRLKNVEVGFTITTLDEEVQRFFEPGSSPASARLAALAELAKAGIKTWAFCGPFLPFLSDGEEQIDALFAALARAGISYIIVDSMKLSGAIGGKVRRALEKHYPDLVEGYRHIAANRQPYHGALMARARMLAEKHGLTIE
ncbi:MAG: radical SAM protein [Anaerolineae bacterium]|nr:radical SAM protein [Anaerolineae bacterium]MDH7475006.1 radical SAM protein [Anaerolineae bacterium]